MEKVEKPEITDLQLENFVSSKVMLDWRYMVLLQQLDQVQLHSSDLSCPCRLKAISEFCISKHLNLVASLAYETAAMDKSNCELFLKLGKEATEQHLKTKTSLCNKADNKNVDNKEILSWSRLWRKKIEYIYYYSCQ